MTCCLYSLVKWMWEMNRAKRLSLALVHFVIERASLLTDRRISGLSMRSKHKHFRTIWEHTSDTCPTDSNSPQDKEWIHRRFPRGPTTWKVMPKCVERYCEVANKTTYQLYKISTHGSLSDAFAEKFGFKHGSVTVNNVFAHVALSLSAHQVYMIKERCRYFQINFFIEYFHIGPRFCLFPSNLMSFAYTVKNYPFRWFTDRQRPGISPSLTANWMKRKRRQKGLRRGRK